MADHTKEAGQQDPAHSLRSEELAAQKTAAIGRSAALTAIAVLVTFLSPWPGPLFTYSLLLVFAFLGWGAWLAGRAEWARPWHQYVFVFADFALLTFTLLYPNPLVPFDYPPQFALRYGSFIFFFVLLAGLAYVYQPKLVLWGGISAVVAWAAGVGLLLRLPDTVSAQPEVISVQAVLQLTAQPGFIDLGVRVQEIAVFLISASLLALAVRRSRRIALRQAALAQQRENLGRYFPRKTAQLLAERTDPFSAPREHKAAVLFADLVAFTKWSEAHSPQETIELLRQVHGLLAEVVFRHGGTLDKFTGDGLMATFGTPEPGKRDAFDALSAMVEMADSFADWSSGPAAPRQPDLGLSVGVHYGPVVIGNIGTPARLEFAVLGDTVNVASRLEGATRKAGCRCLASADLVDAAKAEAAAETDSLLQRLRHHGPVHLRGRDGEISAYRL